MDSKRVPWIFSALAATAGVGYVVYKFRDKIFGSKEKLFIEGKSPEQKIIEGKAFPLILTPTRAVTVEEVKKWISSNKEDILNRVSEHGVVMFRGIPQRTPQDFDEFCTSFGFDALPYIGGAAPRTNVWGNVHTTNESPPSSLITFHHELAQVPRWPHYLFFFCEVAPKEGGETPVVLSNLVYQALESKHKAFVDKIAAQGVRYTRILSNGDDATSPMGRGWQNTYGSSDKSVVEQKLVELGIDGEWMANGCLKTTTHLPAIVIDKRSGKKMWFNQLYAAYTGWKDSRNDPTKAVCFGDGSTFPTEPFNTMRDVMEKYRVDMKWQVGDVMFINNIAAMHSRNTFTPPRRILAGLFHPYHHIAVGEGL